MIECLRQAALAGYTGMETGRRFPMTMAELGPVLAKHGMAVCGGWFSGTILDGDLAANKDRIRAQGRPKDDPSTARLHPELTPIR